MMKKRLTAPQTWYWLGLVLFLVSFILPQPAQAGGFLVAAVLAGYHIVGEGFAHTYAASKEQRRFVPNVHLLMSLAAVGAVLIGHFEEATLLILIFAGAHFLEGYAEGKSKREITALLAMNPVEARRLTAAGTVDVVPVDQLKVGDRVQVLNGDQVPTDGQVVAGQATLNESSINGESIPREKGPGDVVFGSTINGATSFEMVVTKDSRDTVFAKILALVEQSQTTLGKTATRIEKFEPIYVRTVLALLPVVLLAGPLVFQWSWSLTLYRTVVFLIAASPCALAAAAVPATLSGLSNLAKRGVLFKGGAYLTQLAELQAVAFDKTGTLTVGRPEVTDIYFTDAVDQSHLVPILKSMEAQSNHPLATAIVTAFADVPSIPVTVTNELGKGIYSQVAGQKIAIAKPTSFAHLTPDFQARIDRLAQAGKTVVVVAVDDHPQGLLALMDLPNQAAAHAIDYFQDHQIHTTMITGDAQLTGEAVARQLGIDELAANVLPEDKAAIVQRLQRTYPVTAMVGDGVNDAPALVTADIGVAMGDGTDVAIDVADVVLMQNDLAKLAAAHQISVKLNRVVWENIIFAMAVVVLLVGLNFMGLANITWGVVLHEGSTLLVILNGLRLLLVNPTQPQAPVRTRSENIVQRTSVGRRGGPATR